MLVASLAWAQPAVGTSTVTALGTGRVAAGAAAPEALAAPRAFTNRIVFVVGATRLSRADAAVRKRLLATGRRVSVVDDGALTRRVIADLDDAELVVLSATVSTKAVRKKLARIDAPLLTWASRLHASNGLSTKKAGATKRTNALRIVRARHPLAAGKSGKVVVTKKREPLSFGTAPRTATVIARPVGSSTQSVIHTFEPGDRLTNGRAAASCRTTFFLSASSARRLTANGRALLDAAIAHTLDCDDDPVAPVVDVDDDGFSPPADCDDTDPAIFPGAPETADDGVDSNCDGEDPVTPPVDADGDGFSPPADCDDTDPDIFPGAPETPGDTIDSNCDGLDPDDPGPEEPEPVVSSQFLESLEFLFDGPDAVQVGLEPGAVEEATVAAVRGRVVDRAGQPVDGVTISVLDRPELGSTTTADDDGTFTMVVQGGGVLTVQFALDGHLVVQRQADMSWQDYTVLDDVVLTPVDSESTVVDLTSGVDVSHVASTTTDDDGDRAAAVTFRAGTDAVMTLPNGSTQPLTSMTVRATEMTVGESGPDAMVGALPFGTLYTYAVDVTVDEAEAVGATRIDFDQPVGLMVDNFLGFPVGTSVPVGYYDRVAAAWLPTESPGIVVGVVSVSGGLARLDLDGDGDADSTDDTLALAAGLADADRAALATHPGVGQSAWWAPVTHFTPFDLNWLPNFPPELDMENLWDELNDFGEDGKGGDKKNPCPGGSSSVISCVDGALFEMIDMVGVEMPLVYDSESVAGFVDGRTITIPVTGVEVDPAMLAVEVVVEVAGRRFEQRHEPLVPEMEQVFTWDGLDAFDRPVAGAVPVDVTVTALVDATYATGPFGAPPTSSSASTGVSTREPVQYVRRWSGEVSSTPRPSTESIGGWSLAMHHRYDPVSGVLHLGDGTERMPEEYQELGYYWRLTGAGTGGVGGEALTADPQATALALGPDGTVYLAVPDEHRVLAIGRDGMLSVVAGTGAAGDTGDGGPATAATLESPAALAVLSDGSLLIADAAAARVRRVDGDGQIHPFAGTGVPGSDGDGSPASDARLTSPVALDVTPDGTVLIADSGAAVVRAVRPDGAIDTYAGGGLQATCPTDCARDELSLAGLTDVAVDEGGTSVVIVAQGNAHQSTPAGLFRTRASLDPFVPSRVTFRGSSVVLASDIGYVELLATGGVGVASIDLFGTGAASAALGGPIGGQAIGVADLVVAPGGEIVFIDLVATSGGGPAGIDGVMVLGGPLPSGGSGLPLHGPRVGTSPAAAGAAHVAVSPSGSEIYLFDASGRHLRTVAADTLVTSWSFGYDADGALVTLTRGNGQVTTIERVDGRPVAIVGPFGHRTTMSLGATGMITAVAGPGGWNRTFVYDDENRLIGHTDPGGNAASYTYGDDGRLTGSVAADGTTYSLTLTETERGRTGSVAIDGQVVKTVTSELVTPSVGALAAADTRRTTTTFPDGSEHVVDQQPDENIVVTTQTGVITTYLVGPDPRFGGAAMTSTATYWNRGDGFVGDFASVTESLDVDMDTIGDPLSVTRVERVHTTDDGGVSTSVIDPVARTVTLTDARGTTEVITYDERGLATSVVTGDDTEDIGFTYDESGLMLTRTVGDRTTTMAYDEGRLVTATLPDGRTQTFEYDAQGNRIGNTDDGGISTEYAFDALGHPVGWTTAEGVQHTSTMSPGGRLLSRSGPPQRVAALSYDDTGLLESVQHGDGTATTISYDDRKPTLVDGAEIDVEILQYQPTPGFTGTTSVVAQARWSTTGRSVLYTADTRSDVTVEATWQYGATSKIVNWQWSGLNVASRAVDYDSPTRLTMTYDGAQDLVSVGPWTLQRGGPLGAPTSFDFGTTSVAQTLDEYGYISGRTASVEGTPAASSASGRDVNGLVTTQEIVVDGDTVVDHEYVRDDSGRVVEVRDGAGDLVESSEFDLDGNRVSFTRGATTIESTFSNGVITSYDGQPVTVDDNGMIVQRTDLTLNNAATGELLSATRGVDTVTYSYDHTGRRVVRHGADGVTWYLYGDPLVPGRVTDTVAPDGTLTQYLYDESGFIFALRHDDTWYSVIVDAVGSPVAIVDTDGVVVDQRVWSTTGELLSDSNPAFDVALGYAGGIEDPTTGLVRFGARDYDPVLGQWLTPDPASIEGRSANLYRYAELDPVTFRDPAGTASASAGAGYGAYVGGEYIINTEGVSVCVEVGAGLGVGVGFDPTAGLPEHEDSVVSEAGFGPATYTTELTWENGVPCAKGGWAPESVLKNPKNWMPTASAGSNGKTKWGLPDFDVGFGAKAAYRKCFTTRW